MALLSQEDRNSILSKLSYDPSSSGLKSFQEHVGLAADGIYGPKTDAAVRRYADMLRMMPAAVSALRDFRITHYYVTDEEDYPGAATVPVYDPDRKVIRRVPPRLFAHMSIEGTGRFRDGSLLNVHKGYVPVVASDFAGVKAIYDGYVAWAKSRGLTPKPSQYWGIKIEGDRVVTAQKFYRVPDNRVGKGYGTGRLGIAHDPFRTLAADLGAYGTSDPRFKKKGGLVPAGTRVFILEAVGIPLPDGTVHDGWFTVCDTGGGIFGAHFDVFAGSRALFERVRKTGRGLGHHAHVWFDGIEARIAADYTWGVEDR